MRKVVQGFLIFFALTGGMTCSMRPPEPYALKNPLLAAFRHEINLDTLKAQMANDSLIQVVQKKDGYLLYKIDYPADFHFWINDSLLIARQLNNYNYVWRHRTTVGERALIEAAFRKTNANLSENLMDMFFRYGPFHFLDQSLDQAYELDRQPKYVFLEMDSTKIHPVDNFIWQSSVFENPATYQFANGKLNGPFSQVDSSGLVIEGTFNDGLESGIWKYKNSSGKLQYIEEYHHGEIQKVVVQADATYKRSKPLSTLKNLLVIHRVAIFLIGALGIFLLYKYLPQLRNFKRPYEGKTAWENFGMILTMPFLVLATAWVGLMIASMVSLIPPILGWDLSVDFLDNLRTVFIFIFLELIFLLVTTRFKDLLWHLPLLIVVIVFMEELSFLQRLGIYF